jgi:hypothetical protein
MCVNVCFGEPFDKRSFSERFVSQSAVSKETGLSRQTLIRIRDKPAIAAAVLERWGM